MKTKTLDEWAKDYNDYREAYNLSDCNKRVINTFINWCKKTYPEELYPVQELIDEWGTKRDTENNATHTARTRSLNRLIDFMNDRGCDFKLIEHEPVEPTPEPRLITIEEFKNVLKAADEIETVSEKSKYYKRSMCRALEMPVMLRLMYSTGIRPPEARLLDCGNIDFENGLMYIKKGKGYRERIVPLDPEMNILLKRYDEKMSKLMPGRIPFFPDDKGNYRSNHNLEYNWRKLCDKYNVDTAPKNGTRGLDIYTLRHLHITKNIEALPQDGFNKDIKLLAISRYAGHANVDVTIKNYYHLTPRSGELFDEKMGDTLNNIIPDIED